MTCIWRTYNSASMGEWRFTLHCRRSMHKRTGKTVAVKIIDLEHATDEIEDVQRVRG